MALSTSTSLNDAVASEVVADQIVATAFAANVTSGKIKLDRLSGSLVKSYTRLVAIAAAAMTETVDGTATQATDTQVSVTLAEVGLGVMLTDLMRVGSSVADIQARLAELLGKGYAKKVDQDVLVLANSLTDEAGVIGSAATEDSFLQCTYEIEANDAQGYQLAAFVHPKQAHDLSKAFGGVTENQSALLARVEILSRLGPAMANGFKYSAYGVDVFTTTNTTTANSTSNHSGCVVVVGPDSPFVRTIAVLDGELWDGRYELERDASYRATEAWFTGAYGVACIAPDRGCRYISHISV